MNTLKEYDAIFVIPKDKIIKEITSELLETHSNKRILIQHDKGKYTYNNEYIYDRRYELSEQLFKLLLIKLSLIGENILNMIDFAYID